MKQSQPTISRRAVLRGILTALNCLLWAFPMAILTCLLMSVVGEALNRRYSIGDDWVLLTLPLGAVAGICIGIFTRYIRWLHLALLPTGLIAAAYWFLESHEYAKRAESLTGVLGPFSGFGEAIASKTSFVLAIFALMLVATALIGLVNCALREDSTDKLK